MTFARDLREETSAAFEWAASIWWLGEGPAAGTHLTLLGARGRLLKCRWPSCAAWTTPSTIYHLRDWPVSVGEGTRERAALTSGRHP